MRISRKWIGGIIALVIIAGAIFHFKFRAEERPPLEDFRAFFEEPALESARVQVTFLGVATLLFDDGETAFMTDGFFSRPSRQQVFTRYIAPNEEIIGATLKKHNITKLAAVIPIHSHYDHAMDSPSVALRTGAVVMGSRSSANIARGYGLADKQIQVIEPGRPYSIGKFKVTFLLSKHAPGGTFEGEIPQPVGGPVHARRYRMGECYSLLIEHEGRTILVQGTAGFEKGALAGRNAETVYLGVGGIGDEPESYKQEYWNETVGSVGAKRIRVIHWDNFFLGLDQPLEFLPYTVDNFGATFAFLRREATKVQADVRIPVFGQAADPFKEP